MVFFLTNGAETAIISLKNVLRDLYVILKSKQIGKITFFERQRYYQNSNKAFQLMENRSLPFFEHYSAQKMHR